MAGHSVGPLGPLGATLVTPATTARLLVEQARVQGAAGNLETHARLARETQRERDLFTATRERPLSALQTVDRAAPAAATGDHQRPPRRSLRDLFRLRRRAPR